MGFEVCAFTAFQSAEGMGGGEGVGIGRAVFHVVTPVQMVAGGVRRTTSR